VTTVVSRISRIAVNVSFLNNLPNICFILNL
jgi:hypothetical protein